jgi:hypothetical protein
MFPRLDELYELARDPQGEVYGLRALHEPLRHHAQARSRAEFEGALTSDDPSTTLAALQALTHAPWEREAELRPLGELLTDLMADPRAHAWAWGERPYQRRTFSVAPLAVEARAHLLALEARAWRAAQARRALPAQPPPFVGASLVACMERALTSTTEAARELYRAARRLQSSALAPDNVGALLGAVAVEAALDEGRVAELRMHALRELQRAAPTLPGASAELARGLAGFVEALTHERVDVRLKRAARGFLLDVAPKRLDTLQDAGVWPPDPLPAPSALVSAWGRVEEPLAQAWAARVSWPEALGTMKNDAPEARITGAALAPWLAERGEWPAFGRALLPLLDDARRWLPPQAPPRSPGVEVGAFAARRLLRLLAPHLHRGHPDALALLHEGLARLLDRPAPLGREPASLPNLYTDALRHTPAAALETLRERLALTAADPAQPPGARMAALLLDARPERLEASAAWLEDPSTPGPLRAMIGAHLHRWSPAWLDARVDRAHTPWALRPEAQTDLPISEPAREVPLPWLLATLLQGHHDAQAHAAQQLGARLCAGAGLAAWEQNRATLLAALPHEARDPLRAALRPFLDDPHPDAPRWGACVALALLGDPRDEGALLSYMLKHGPWLSLDPSHEELPPSRLVDHLLLRPLLHPEPHHLLEPYLLLGLGEPPQRRLLARLLAQLGADAAHEGHWRAAIHAATRARALDPLNLDARRLGKTLGL